MRLRGYALALLAVVALVLCATAILGGGASDDFAQAPIEKHGSSDTLVVLLHSLGSSPQDLAHVKAVVRRNFPNADILSPAYLAHPFANTSPAQLAAKLDRRLEDTRCRESGGPGYGKSSLSDTASALLARRTYLRQRLSRGVERPKRAICFRSQARRLTNGSRPWTGSLLAAMNGLGYAKDRQPHMGDTIQTAAGVAGAGNDTREAAAERRRGAIHQQRNRLDSDGPSGSVERASVVSCSANVTTWSPGRRHRRHHRTEFYLHAGGRYDHNNITEMSPTEASTGRRAEVFEQALREPWIACARAIPKPRPLDLRCEGQAHRFIKHGIRDMADGARRCGWTGESGEGDPRCHRKIPIFLDAVLPGHWDRQGQVRRFVDEYAQALAEFPNATKVSFVGHSFRTYILAAPEHTPRCCSIDSILPAASYAETSSGAS